MMDIASLSVNGAVSAVLAQQQASSQEQVGVTMLKKAIDNQAQSALALVQSIPQLPSAHSLPFNLGNHINTMA